MVIKPSFILIFTTIMMADDKKVEYTVIFFGMGIYHKYKVKIKSDLNKYGLRWNPSKSKSYDNVKLKGFLRKFNIETKMINNETLVNRGGNTGVWEGGDHSVLGVMFEKVNKDEHLPIILIH